MRDPGLDNAAGGERGLAGILADALAENEREAATSPPLPDFGEVLRRAQGLDPTAVSDEMLEEAAKLAPVVRLAELRTAPAAEADDVLTGFIADARRHNEGIADERRLAGIPPLPRPPRRFRSAGVMAAVGVAAALALVWIGPAWSTASILDDEQTASAAMMRGVIDRTEATLTVLQEVEARTRKGRVRADEAKAPELATERAQQAEDAPPDTPQAPAGGEPDPARPAQERRVQRSAGPEERAAELRAIDEEAQAAWRRGDLRAAERGFRQLIRRAPRGRWAQLAYGDLFNLVRQAGDTRAELSLWREYLQRYPDGPHADDAQAGTCRRSPSADVRACWRAYLEARPRGAYRQQAGAALASVEAEE